MLFQTAERHSDYDTYRRNQVVRIRGRLVAGTALRNPGVADLPSIRNQVDPAEWLGKRIHVDFIPDSEIMRISISGDDEQERRHRRHAGDGDAEPPSRAGQVDVARRRRVQDVGGGGQHDGHH